MARIVDVWRATVRRFGAGTSRAKGPWGSTDLTGTDDELGGGVPMAAGWGP
jgi:hypothetical protein